MAALQGYQHSRTEECESFLKAYCLSDTQGDDFRWGTNHTKGIVQCCRHHSITGSTNWIRKGLVVG